MKRWNIVLTGYGNVGRAIAMLLDERRERYRTVYGADVRLTGIRRAKAALANAKGLALDAITDEAFAAPQPFADFLAQARADLLIEAGPTDIRTGAPGLEHIRVALASGRHVIAVSKGALVVDGAALKALAETRGLALEVSGAAAAALPTIDLIRHATAGCPVLTVEGILNATSNALLDMMMDDGLGLDEALERARHAGIAEADPSLDIDGWDTACKMAIIATFGLDEPLTLDRLSVDGIRHVEADQLARWRAEGLRPRLVGRLERDGGRLTGSIALRACRPDNPFALVHGRNKAIRIETDGMGELAAMGGGSEPRATAAAALKDLEHILAAQC